MSADVKAHMTEEAQPLHWITDGIPFAMVLLTIWCLDHQQWGRAAAAFVALFFIFGWDIARSLRQRKTLTINTTVRATTEESAS